MSILKEQIYKSKLAKPEIFEEYSKRGVTSIFVYSPAILKNGEMFYYDETNRAVRTLMIGEQAYAPASFFSRFLRLTVEESGDNVTVSSPSAVLCANVGEKSYLLNGRHGEFSSPVTFKNGHKYLPAISVANALSIPCRVYDGGKLCIFADENILDEIERDVELQVSASYATLGKYDASKFTDKDFELVKNKWRTVLAGSAEINGIDDPDMREKLQSIADAAQREWNAMNKIPSRVILFGEEPPIESSALTTQYSKLWVMTKGYATYGSPLYGNQDLRDAILDGLQWMYENMYGEAEIEGRGWRNIRAFNWYDWFYGAVDPLTNILLLMEDYLTMEQKQTYLKCFKYVMTFSRVGYIQPCAMSRLIVCTKTALLLEDRPMLENACSDYDLTLHVTRTDEGVHTDYVRWAHNYPYNMVYGFTYLDRVALAGTIMGGTAMEFLTPNQYELYKMAKYMFETACYKGQGFMIFNGRANAGTEFSSGVSIMRGILPLIGLFGEEEDIHLKKLVKRCASTPELISMLKNNCTVYNFSKLMEILRDDTISAKNDYEICHAWYTGDRIVQHRNDYAMLVAMPSSRHPSYESINSANKRGWYTGDGALYLYTNSARNVYDGENFIKNENICYRIPGTTVDDRKRQAWSYRNGWLPSKDFAGCMDVRAKFGMAAFEYESYNYAGHEADGTLDNDYGGGFTYFENDLTAKKSYFFFDRECVCLGADINSTMNANVLTTLEHRRLVKNGDVLGCEDIYLNGEIMPKTEYEHISDNAKWIWLEGVAGYVILQGEKTRLCRYNTTKNDTSAVILDAEQDNYAPFFEINLYHGKNPNNASYQYVLLPYSTAEETAKYSASPEIEVLSNTKSLQAVRKAALGLTFMAFYEAGSYHGITVDKPCLVILSEENGKLTVSVCEPTHKEASVVLTLDKEYRLLKNPIAVMVTIENGKTVLNIDTDYATGEPRRVELALD